MDNPLEALATVPGPGQGVVRVNYPVINDQASTGFRIDQGGSGNNTTLQAVFTAAGCSATQWPEFQYRFRVNTVNPANGNWSDWSTWGSSDQPTQRTVMNAANTARVNTSLPSAVSAEGRTATVSSTSLVSDWNQPEHIYVRVPVEQGHRGDFQVRSRCIDPYTQDSLNNKGPVAPLVDQNKARDVENPVNLWLEQPFWPGTPNGTVRSVGMSANCNATSTSIQYQWRNDGAGGNTGVWQGWFNPNSGNGFRTSNITATWANWYGSSASYICVGVFVNSGTEFRQTGGVQAEIPPAPSGVWMNVSGSNVDTWRGSVWTGTTVSTSASWDAGAGGNCPGGTWTRVDWSAPPSQGASASRYSGSPGTYYSDWETRGFGATLYCVANDNGIAGGGTGTGWQYRSVRVGANWQVPPYPGTPTGGSYNGTYNASTSQFAGYTLNTINFNGSGAANASNYTNQVNLQGTSLLNGGAWMGWGGYGCQQGVSQKMGRSMASNGWGSSGWYTTGASNASAGLQHVGITCY